MHCSSALSLLQMRPWPVLLLCVLTQVTVGATTVTWTGAVSNNWQTGACNTRCFAAFVLSSDTFVTAGNWDTGKIPVAGDIVYFSDPTNAKSFDVVSTAAIPSLSRVSFDSPTSFDSGGYDFTVQAMGFRQSCTITMSGGYATSPCLNFTDCLSYGQIDLESHWRSQSEHPFACSIHNPIERRSSK